jgi:hypothetical protein
MLRINRRRKVMYGGVFSETILMSVPGVELVGEHQHGRALTSEPLRRQSTSPGGRSKLGRQGGRSRRKGRHEEENPARRVLNNFRAPAARRIRLR